MSLPEKAALFAASLSASNAVCDDRGLVPTLSGSGASMASVMHPVCLLMYTLFNLGSSPLSQLLFPPSTLAFTVKIIKVVHSEISGATQTGWCP